VTLDQIILPMRKQGQEMIMECRPAYVEDWLETLPYTDFRKTVAVLSEAVKATNQISMKAAQRFELVTLYHRSYEYYINTQIKNLGKQASPGMGQQFTQAQDMKQFAIQLSHACKITANEALSSKTLFGQTKPPVQATLMSMIYLSHALIYSFLKYSPVPKKVWLELNALYVFASGIKQARTTITPLGESNIATTIEHAYKQILLASLSDPLHLPFGSIWEVYEQLNVWAEFAQLQTFAKVKNTAGYFIVNTKEDMQPIPYSKFEISLANQNHLLLDANSLRNIVQNYLQILESGKTTDNKFLLSRHIAKSLLVILGKSWGLTAKRYFPRKASTGKIDIASGMNACYYFHNNENDMAQRADAYQNSDISLEEDDPELRQSTAYISDQWKLSDLSSGGYCISKTKQPTTPLRVGEIVGLKSNADNPQNNWELGVLRWLMIRQQNNYKAGIQILSTHAQIITIKALSGGPAISVIRRGFLTDDPKTGRNVTVITSSGLYAPQRELEIVHREKTHRVVVENLLESSANFEQFSYKLI
jgi:cyclic-di-GMP-binding protein